MTRKLQALCVALSMLAAPSAMAALVEHGTFHPADTVAEKALDAILAHSREDDRVNQFLMGLPWYVPTQKDNYQDMFSRALQQDIAAQEAAVVQRDCGGTYRDGELCGLNFDPVSCSQDPAEAYAYRTLSLISGTAIIRAQALTTTALNTYYLIKDHDHWMIDGIDCGDGVRFHIPK